jgi:polar amino acid transport system substrate-binding protein
MLGWNTAKWECHAKVNRLSCSMLRKQRRITLMRLLTALFLLTLGTIASATELKITASTWPPYVSAQLYHNGVAAVLTEEALKRAGYTSTTTIEPWPAALEATLAGTYDVITSLWLTAERSEQLNFSEPLMTNYIIFVIRDDSGIVFNDRSDLDGRRIGIVTDYAYSEEPYDTTGLEISAAGSVQDNIRKLLAGELDLVVADGRVAAYEINQLVAAKQLTIIRKPLAKRGLRIAVSRQHPEHEKIVSAINEGIIAMRADGSYNEILATFRISD